MSAYLFHRRDFGDEVASPALVSGEAAIAATSVYFQMWTTRADPYNRFSDGDLVYIADQAQRRIIWEARASRVLTDFHYSSIKHALGALRSAYGLYSADLNGYHRERTGHGWLLAWAPTVMRRLNVAMPDGYHFGRNGYRTLAQGDADSLGLPAPKLRRPLASPPEWYAPSAAKTGVLRRIPRYIPMHVRRAVIVRDRGQCVGCGETVNLHFDHILPWSHGGASTLHNLRLLCARSNLAKGAGLATGQPVCAAAGLQRPNLPKRKIPAVL